MSAVEYGSRKDRRKKTTAKPNVAVLLLLFLVALIAFLYIKPVWEYHQPDLTAPPDIYYQGELCMEKGLYREGEIYFPLAFVRRYLDSNIWWDEKNSMVIVTTEEKVYHFVPDSKEVLLNLQQQVMAHGITASESIVYVPAALLRELYEADIIFSKERNTVSVRSAQDQYLTGTIDKSGRMRAQATRWSGWTGELEKGETVKISSEAGEWLWVEKENGSMGYYPKSRVEPAGVNGGVPEEKPGESRDAFKSWKTLQEPVLLTWEYVFSTTANPAIIGILDGVQVISPTWFQLEESGVVSDKGSQRYVDWAHSQGKKVWGVFFNDCEIDLTHEFLSDAALRIKAYEQILEYAERYGLDGIDIDFEYMYMEDKEAFVQFVREITPLLHEKGLNVTLYVIFHSTSERWSRCYDHRRLSEVADYLIVMAYDQHTARAGSVASLPWVERGVVRMLEDVPAEKLLLGIPLYTRLWKEETDENGELKTTRSTLTLPQAEKWIEDKAAKVVVDNDSGQHYAEVQQGKAVYKMWLEDEYSQKKRVALMKKYRLAGIAAWRRGLEKEGTWRELTELLKSDGELPGNTLSQES